MSDETDATSPPTPSDAPAAPAEPTAADFIGDTGDDDSPEPDNSSDAPTISPDADNAHPEGDDEPAKEAADDDPLADDGIDDPDTPPEFWSAERKALWAKVTDPEVRAAIKDHVRAVSVATAHKLEENAGKVRQAEESAKLAVEANQQNMAWWQQNAPMLQQIIEGEFAGLDWNKLSAEDPAGWARAKQGYEARQNWLRGVAGRLQQDAQQHAQRAQQAEHQARVAEHQKLATKYPKAFGDAKTAQRTYDTLSGFLAELGVPAERIRQVYEAPIVEIVMDAYKYRQLRAKAPGVTAPKPPAAPASKTPMRVAPGARSSASPAGEAERQALERLKSGARLTFEDSILFR